MDSNRYEFPFVMERLIIAMGLTGDRITAPDTIETIDDIKDHEHFNRLSISYTHANKNLARQKVLKRKCEGVFTETQTRHFSILRKKALARYQMIRNQRVMFSRFIHV